MKTIAGILILLSLSSLAAAQSLGEAARKEEERKRKKHTSPAAKAKTVTDDDLQAIHDTEDRQTANPADKSAPPPPPPSTSRYQVARPAIPESDRTRGQEQEWRSRMAAARARVDKAQKDLAEAQQHGIIPGAAYVDRRTNQPVYDAPQRIETARRRAQAELDAARKALDNLEDAARRANVPPGWLR